MRSYITLQPHSNTNPTDRHRVVEFDAWKQYVEGDAPSYAVESSHATAAEAQKAAADLNDVQ